MRFPLLAMLGSLLLAAPAFAKEVDQATFCGRDGCSTHAAVRDLPLGGEQRASEPSPAPYYTVETRLAPGGQTVNLLYVPAAQVVALEDRDVGAVEWYPIVGHAANKLMRRLAGAHEPHAAPGAWPTRVAPSPGPQLSPAASEGADESRAWWLALAGVFALGAMTAGAARLRRRLAAGLRHVSAERQQPGARRLEARDQ